MSQQSSTPDKNLKFSIGSIFFILSAIAIICCHLARIICGLIIYKPFQTDLFSLRNFIAILANGVPSTDLSYIVFAILTVVSFLALGAVLLLKKRNKLLLVAPAVFGAANLLMLVSCLESFVLTLCYAVDYDWSGQSLPDLLLMLITALSYALIIVGSVAFCFTADACLNGKAPKHKLTKWISPATIGLGTLALTLSNWLGYIINIIRMIQDDYSLTFRHFISQSNVVEDTLLFVLLTAAFLFTTLWMTNPNKKSEAEADNA